MTIPPQIDALVPGLNAMMAQFAESYRRDVKTETGRDQYPNWEFGMFPIDLLVPGVAVSVQRYNVGGTSPGWFLTVRFTDGVSTSEKVVDNGAGTNAHDWTEVTP